MPTQKTKQATLAEVTQLINKQFDKCPFIFRKALFINLEDYAQKSLGGEAQEIFLKALYEAERTQDIQILMIVDKAVGKIMKGGEK